MATNPLARAIEQTSRDYYNRSEEDRLRALALEDEARRRNQALQDRSYWDAETRRRNAADADANVARQLEAEKARLLALPEAQKRGIAASLGIPNADTMPLAELNGLIQNAQASELEAAARLAAQTELKIGNEFLKPRQELEAAQNAPGREYAAQEAGYWNQQFTEASSALNAVEQEAVAAQRGLVQAIAASVRARDPQRYAGLPDDQVIADDMGAQMQLDAGLKRLSQEVSTKARNAQSQLARAQTMLQGAATNARGYRASYWNTEPAPTAQETPKVLTFAEQLEELRKLREAEAPPAMVAPVRQAPPGAGTFAPPPSGRGAFMPGPKSDLNPFGSWWKTPSS